MRAATLHHLGRRLSNLAEEMTGTDEEAGATPGELAILDDLLLHPRSTVGEVTERTGFAQSHVSTSLARLVDRGQVSWEQNPADARSRWADLSPKERKRRQKQARLKVEEALAQELGTKDAERLVKLLARAAKILDVKKASALRS